MLSLGLSTIGRNASSTPVFGGAVTGDKFIATSTSTSEVRFSVVPSNNGWLIGTSDGNAGIRLGTAGSVGLSFHTTNGVAQWKINQNNGNFESDQGRSIFTAGSIGANSSCCLSFNPNAMTITATGGLLLLGGSSSASGVSGDVIVNAGTGATGSKVNGLISANTTGVGNVGASGPDDLQVYNLAANTLTTTARGIRIRAWGTTANNANAKTVRLTIGPTPTALITKQLTASIAGFWELEATILRTGASAQDYFAKAVNYGGTTVSSTDGATVAMLASVGTLTQTETNALDIKVQSTVSTSNNDIVSEGLIVEYI